MGFISRSVQRLKVTQASHGMHYPVYGMVHIKGPLLLFGKSPSSGGSEFPLSLYEWAFTICLMSFNHK